MKPFQIDKKIFEMIQHFKTNRKIIRSRVYEFGHDDILEEDKVIIDPQNPYGIRINWKLASTYPLLLKVLTGYTFEGFLDCFQYVKDIISPFNQRAPKRILSPEDIWLAFLTYFYSYCPFSSMEVFFGIPRASMNSLFKKFLVPIHNELKNQIHWISKKEQEKNNIGFPNYPKAMAVVDATVQEIQRPKNKTKRTLTYSGKHKKYCFKSLTIHSPNGLMMDCVPGVTGKNHDKIVWDITDWSDKCEEIVRDKNGKKKKKRYQILADSGFQGIQKQCKAVLPSKKTSAGLTQEKIHNNIKLSSDRVLVENYYGRLKKFNIMMFKFRGNMTDFRLLFVICSALTNLKIQLTPLRTTTPEKKKSKCNKPNFFQMDEDDQFELIQDSPKSDRSSKENSPKQSKKRKMIVEPPSNPLSQSNSPKKPALNFFSDLKSDGPSQKSNLSLKGIENPCNSCFMISVLQLFLRTNGEFFNPQGSLVEKILSISQQMKTEKETVPYSYLVSLQNDLKGLKKMYGPNPSQKDAHDFLDFLLDNLRIDSLLLYNNTLNKKIQIPIRENLSLIRAHCGLEKKKIFYGACGHWSETETEFYSLNIFLHPPVANTPIHLLDLIDSYFSLIHPDKDNLMICEECKKQKKKNSNEKSTSSTKKEISLTPEKTEKLSQKTKRRRKGRKHQSKTHEVTSPKDIPKKEEITPKSQSQQFFISDFPHFFWIHLERFWWKKDGSTGKKNWPVVIPDKIDLQKYGEENWIPHNIQDISTPPCILSNQSSPLNEVDERIESIETNQSNNLKEKDLLNENNQSLYSSSLVFSSKSSQSNQIDERIESIETNQIDESIESIETNQIDERIESIETNQIDERIESIETNQIDERIESIETNQSNNLKEKDLLNETNKSINKDNKEYSLRGAILHLGISLKEGHYIALWRNKENGKWYVFDDSKVFFVRNPIKYLTNNASILLYEKMKNSNQNKSEYSSPNLKKVENNSVLKKTEDEKTSKVDMRMLSQDNIQNLINQLKDQKI
ncbi:ubiquitin carboxyl-terminal hydrolase [Anaeramoeba ignava]|uniref:Ubiquitin carboxyl-terminal hydrolase n=1 Tax=Anaeramoeba ignava TaxID=1746090 RepID=A0A9Q0LHA3_ANAIG|nr:ubiquitin carboxyl-terminal hydrolase [Anaeramoeba ignava]